MVKTVWGDEALFEEDEFEDIDYNKTKTKKRLKLARRLFK